MSPSQITHIEPLWRDRVASADLKSFKNDSEVVKTEVMLIILISVTLKFPSYSLSIHYAEVTSDLSFLSYFICLCFSVLPPINPLNPELNLVCYLLALLACHFLHISRIRVKSLTLRLVMSYIYGAPILDVSRSHTMTQHGR
jgi:hypothetical protein